MKLSDREKRIVFLLKRGRNQKEISQDLKKLGYSGSSLWMTERHIRGLKVLFRVDTLFQLGMKIQKIGLILLVLFSLNIGAQTEYQKALERQIINIGLDPMLLAEGGYPNDENPDNDESVLHFHFSMLVSKPSGAEIGAYGSYANLQPYNYFDYGFLYNRNIRILNTYKIESIIGATIGGIVRTEYPGGETQKHYFDYGLNIELRWWITDWFGTYLKFSGGPRNDLDFYGHHDPIHYDGEWGLLITFY